MSMHQKTENLRAHILVFFGMHLLGFLILQALPAYTVARSFMFILSDKLTIVRGEDTKLYVNWPTENNNYFTQHRKEE